MKAGKYSICEEQRKRKLYNMIICTFFIEPGKAIGKLMYERKLSKQPLNLLGKKILAFSNSNPHVMRLVTFLTHMVAFTSVERVDILEVMEVIADVYQKGKTLVGWVICSHLHLINALVILMYYPYHHLKRQ